jgi:hypothetical protein
MLSETKWGPKNYHLIGIYMPFHAAEQHREAEGQVIGCLFFCFVFFGQAKKMKGNKINLIMINFLISSHENKKTWRTT